MQCRSECRGRAQAKQPDIARDGRGGHGCIVGCAEASTSHGSSRSHDPDQENRKGTEQSRTQGYANGRTNDEREDRKKFGRGHQSGDPCRCTKLFCGADRCARRAKLGQRSNNKDANKN